MTTAKQAATPETSKPTETSPANLAKRQAIMRSLMELCLCFPATRIELSEAVQAKYIQRLESLSYSELGTGFQRAEEECKMFPSPAELRQLAGCETARQRGEREAREGLDWILRKIRIHGSKLGPIRGTLIREGYWREWEENGRPRREAVQPEYEMIDCPPPSDKLKRTVEALGNGDKADGLMLLTHHPGFVAKTDAEMDIGKRAEAIEKFERRWVKVWEMANREESVALEVVA